MKKLYSFHWDCGREGDVYGIFVATEERIKRALGKVVSFGSALGKYSDIYGDLEEGDLKVLTDDQDFIEKFEKFVGKSTGYNPLDYIGDGNEE